MRQCGTFFPPSIVVLSPETAVVVAIGNPDEQRPTEDGSLLCPAAGRLSTIGHTCVCVHCCNETLLARGPNFWPSLLLNPIWHYPLFLLDLTRRSRASLAIVSRARHFIACSSKWVHIHQVVSIPDIKIVHERIVKPNNGLRARALYLQPKDADWMMTCSSATTRRRRSKAAAAVAAIPIKLTWNIRTASHHH